jgi:hypothetical protein
MSGFKIPVFILVLDGVGSIFAVLGLLGALEVDIGLPALATIWPVLLVIGFALMVPMIFWAIKMARSKSQD